VSFRSSASTAG